MTTRLSVTLAALLTLASLVVSQSAEDTAELREAAHHFSENGDLEEAAGAYGELVLLAPYDDAIWSDYGNALLKVERFEEAATAFTRAFTLGARDGSSRHAFDTALAHTLAGEHDQALDWLERTFEAGVLVEVERGNPLWTDQVISRETRFDPLHKDPRYQRLIGILPSADISREAGWRFDLDFLRMRISQMHRDPYRRYSKDRLDSEFADLTAKINQLADHELVVATQRLLAMVGDGHTRLHFTGGRPYTSKRFPALLRRFSDGWFVAAAPEEHALIRGCEVERVGDLAVEEAFRRVSPYASYDNEMNALVACQDLLIYADVLSVVGAIPDREELTLTLRKRSGEVFEHTLEARPSVNFDAWPRAYEETAESIPRYPQRRGGPYWLEHMQPEDVVYCQFSRVQESSSEPFEDFCQRLFALVDEKRPKALVIDMRLNYGGDLTLTPPLVNGLIGRAGVDEANKLFVIIGRRTFSAAMYTAGRIERETNATFVGEPTGSCPNFIGESIPIRLPYTELRATISTYEWQGSWAFDSRVWIAPEMVAPLSSEDYLGGRDPALEAILARVASGEVDSKDG